MASKKRPKIHHGSRGADLLFAWRNGRRQFVVCSILELDQTAYSAIESGRVRPGLERAINIAKHTDGAVPVTSWLEPSAENSNRRTRKAA